MRSLLQQPKFQTIQTMKTSPIRQLPMLEKNRDDDATRSALDMPS